VAKPDPTKFVMEPDKITKDSAGGFKNFILNSLTHRRLPIILAILAVLLALPALKVGWLVDDHYIRLIMQGSSHFEDISSGPTGIFEVFDGDAERTHRMMDYGLAPWWTYEKIKANFYRPVSVLTHLLDYKLWPEIPALMHVQSLLWFGLIVIAVTFFYRRFLGPTWMAGLAGLIFAIDDAHSFGASYLPGRNVLLYVLFAVLTIIIHDHWRREKWRAGAILAPLFFLLSLLSHEAGVTTCAYLAAYAIFMDNGTWKKRCITLVPYASMVIVWRIVYSISGYGVAGIGFYVDPLYEPLRFLASVIESAPILLLGQWAIPPSGIAMVLNTQQRHLLWLVAIGFLLLLTVVLIPLLRRDKLARFWAMGMIFSILPICTATPMDRHLFLPGLGAIGLLIQFFAVVFGKIDWRPKNIAWRIAAVTIGWFFVLIHLIIAPLALPLRSYAPLGHKRTLEQLFYINIPMDKLIEEQTVVLVNPPVPMGAAFSPIKWELEKQPIPKHTRVLASGVAPLTIHRQDAQTLIIRTKYGYLASIGDRMFRSEKYPMSVGQQVKLTAMTVEITKLTKDYGPLEAKFKFDVPLEDPSFRWLQWDWEKFSYVEFKVPAIDESIELYGPY